MESHIPSIKNIQHFDIDSLPIDAVVVMIGQHGAGKSWLMRDIMASLHKKKVPYPLVLSGTEASRLFYSHFVPESCIFFSDNETRLAKFVKYQKKHVFCSNDIENTVLLVLDDDTLVRQDDVFEIFANGKCWERSWNTTTYLLTETPYDIAPSLREHIDYLFLFAQESPSYLKKIWKNYVDFIESYDEFHALFTTYTADHQCLVINKTDNKLFYYKAREHEPFQFGLGTFWNVE